MWIFLEAIGYRYVDECQSLVKIKYWNAKLPSASVQNSKHENT